MTARTVAHAPRIAFRALPATARRRLLAAAAVALLLAAGYFGWLRDSALVAVEEVEVSGLTAPSAERIRAALTAAAEEMTTLHVRRDELEQAAAGFPVVQGIEVEADFPHGLRIRVIEHRPVALLASGSDRIPVAGDGTLLPDVEAAGDRPVIRASAAASGGRVSDAQARALVAVAGAAPPALLPRAERIAVERDRGIVVELRDGPDLIFGDGSRAHAKWLAATAVLADPSSQGAGYVDLRIPDRPAAGGLGAETVQPVAAAGAPAAATPAAPAPTQAAPTATPEPQPQVQTSPSG